MSLINIYEALDSLQAESELKERQVGLLKTLAPDMLPVDDYTIYTWQEAVSMPGSFGYGDFDYSDAQLALNNNSISIYSGDGKIISGSFISSSYNYARKISDDGKVYTITVSPNEVAWLNGDEGIFIGKI